MTKPLTNRDQEAIEFLYARGLSQKKVADVFGISEITVFMRLDGIAEDIRNDYQQEVIAEALRMAGRDHA